MLDRLSMRPWLVLAPLVLLTACDVVPTAPALPEPPPEPPPADALEARLRERGREHAAWMMPNGTVQRGDLREHGARDFSQLMQPGWCYKVVGVGGEGIEDLDLRVYDGHDVLVQRDTTQDAEPYVGVESPICPNEAASYRIEVRAQAGSGPFAIQVYRSL